MGSKTLLQAFSRLWQSSDRARGLLSQTLLSTSEKPATQPRNGLPITRFCSSPVSPAMKPRPSQSPALTLLLFDSKGHSSRTETSYILTPLNPLLPTWRFWLQLTILLENRLSQPRATSSASCIPRSIRPCGMSREGGQPLPMLKNLTFCSLTVFGWLAAACVPSLLSTLNSARKESTQEMTV